MEICLNCIELVPFYCYVHIIIIIIFYPDKDKKRKGLPPVLGLGDAFLKGRQLFLKAHFKIYSNTI